MKARDETFFINGEGEDRTMKKRLLLLLGGGACLLAAGYFVHAWLTKSPINRDTFERIEEGMTVKEVEELIGLPPGSYGTAWQRVNVLGDEADHKFWHLSHEKKYVHWSSNDGEITVSVSPDGKVTGKMFYYLEGTISEGPLDTLRRWIGFPREPVVMSIE